MPVDGMAMPTIRALPSRLAGIKTGTASRLLNPRRRRNRNEEPVGDRHYLARADILQQDAVKSGLAVIRSEMDRRPQSQGIASCERALTTPNDGS